MDLASLQSARLLLVTGKGGTGKTTTAAALAVLQAAKGRKTLLCEVDSQRPSLDPIFGVASTFDPKRVTDRLDVANLVWPASLAAYLARTVPMGRMVAAILDNEIVRRFLDFVPGSQELVTLSAIVDQLEGYDVVVVDLPASGHAYAMLDITRSALQLFRGGPVRARVEVLRQTLLAPTTRLVFVALPEEMVVNETLETLGRLRAAELIGGPPVAILNRATIPSLSEAERTLLTRLGEAGLGDDAAEFVAAGRWEAWLEEASAEAIDRRGEGFGEPPIRVAPAGGVKHPRDVVREVAVALGRGIGVARRDLGWGGT